MKYRREKSLGLGDKCEEKLFYPTVLDWKSEAGLKSH